MNVFLKKLQISNSCKSHISPPSSLSILPNELICRILNFLPTCDLLPIYAIAPTLLNRLVVNELMKRLEQHELGIRLYFDQETRWRYTLDMKLHLTRTHRSPRLAFVPTTTKQDHVFYTSKLLRRPQLHKITLVSTHNNDHHHNLLEKPYAMDIKQSGRPYIAEMTSYSLGYNVSETPFHVTKARPGERWIQYLGFQCDPAWLFRQPASNIFNNRWFSLSAYGKVMGFHSTRTTKSPSSACGNHRSQLGIKTNIFGQHCLFHGITLGNIRI